MSGGAGIRASSGRPVLLLAGGGTGGHIFPNVAVYERLLEGGAALSAKLLVSARPGDRRMAEAVGGRGLEAVALRAAPFSVRPWRWPGFLARWRAARRTVAGILDCEPVAALVATGGFVSGPAVAAARAAGVPTCLVSLDAVPGRGGRWLARRVDRVFEASRAPSLPGARPIEVPLRRSAVGAGTVAAAREALALDPGKRVLLVMGGSQGAASMNGAMERLLAGGRWPAALTGWQVLHVAGARDVERLQAAYRAAGVAGRVVRFVDEPGRAWRAATLAVSRAGAGSVAEVRANRVPALFMPYPHHRDEHQAMNARALAESGGAMILRDRVVPEANAGPLAEHLSMLAADAARRGRMREALAAGAGEDGAEAVAAWVRAHLGA